MPDNPRYRNGAIWRTRTGIPAILDAEAAEEARAYFIPRNEYVVVLAYDMSQNYAEDVALLWDGKVVFAYNIDSAHQFDTDPKGFNTTSEEPSLEFGSSEHS